MERGTRQRDGLSRPTGVSIQPPPTRSLQLRPQSPADLRPPLLLQRGLDATGIVVGAAPTLSSSAAIPIALASSSPLSTMAHSWCALICESAVSASTN
eukprot:superscaffoldBa00000427_g4660